MVANRMFSVAIAEILGFNFHFTNAPSDLYISILYMAKLDKK